MKLVNIPLLSPPPGLRSVIENWGNTAGVELAEVLGAESPFTGLQSADHLESSASRCHLPVDMGSKAEFSVEEDA